MEIHERFCESALSFCSSADVLWSADIPDSKFERPHNHYLAPCLLNVGYGYELFLKSVLLEAGISKSDLSRKPFSHDLWYMWEHEYLSDVRSEAKLIAVSAHQDFARWSQGLTIPEQGTFIIHLKHLSELHSTESGYALRYPEEKHSVPEPSLLIEVLDRLIRSWKSKIRIVEI